MTALDLARLVPWLIAVFVALATVLAAIAIGNISRRGELRRRLARLEERPVQSENQNQASGLVETIVRASGPLAKLALPDEDWERSELRQQFVQAGWRSANAPTVFFGLKALLTLLLPAVVLVIMLARDRTPGAAVLLLILVGAGLVGLYGPNMILKSSVEKRRKLIFESLPDALDLMTICMEAGLSLEGALARVADEMVATRPLIASELQLVVLEMRAGRGRETALRNLSRRNGVDELDSLVSALVQAEQFGVSVADSLRLHSEALRGKRKQKAEEQAATVGTRLTFPLMICILPTLMIVVVGPAVLKLIDAFKSF
jgi:tight adherence protein C